MSANDGERLPLREAALRWCDETLVREAQAAELAYNGRRRTSPAPGLFAPPAHFERWKWAISFYSIITTVLIPCGCRCS